MRVNVKLMEQNVSQINAGITINVDVKHNVCEEEDVCNPVTCNCEKTKYCGWFNDYLWWSYKVIRWRNKNYSNKF